MDAQQRIRQLLPTATADQLRAALEATLDATASAQGGPGYADHGINGARPFGDVDAEHQGRSSVGTEVDSGILGALQGPVHTRTCPGWGEECGNETEQGADLCPDCHMARLDTQSPRIPR